MHLVPNHWGYQGMGGDDWRDLTFGNMHKSGYSHNGTKTVAPLNLRAPRSYREIKAERHRGGQA